VIILGILIFGGIILLGLLMMAAGLKGIGRMLGLPVDGGSYQRPADFLCGMPNGSGGTCGHDVEQHRNIPGPCKRCRCQSFSSVMNIQWNASHGVR
jgi:hypothetical protein